MATVQQIASALNLTPRRIQQLVSEGMPQEKRGIYEMGVCLQWYVRYLQQKLNSGGTDTTELSGKERLDLAKAQREEMALAKDQGEMLALGDYEAAMAALLGPARMELLSLEAKLRPQIGAEHSRLVGAEIRRTLRDVVKALGEEFQEETC